MENLTIFIGVLVLAGIYYSMYKLMAWRQAHMDFLDQMDANTNLFYDLEEEEKMRLNNFSPEQVALLDDKDATMMMVEIKGLRNIEEANNSSFPFYVTHDDYVTEVISKYTLCHTYLHYQIGDTFDSLKGEYEVTDIELKRVQSLDEFDRFKLNPIQNTKEEILHKKVFIAFVSKLFGDEFYDRNDFIALYSIKRKGGN